MPSWLPRKRNNSRSEHQDSEQWISVSDLMAGLMMVFLFIAVALMLRAQQLVADTQEVALAYQNTKVAIYEALNDEFAPELQRWRAVIDEKTLAFEFLSPEVLFETGRAELKPEFESILSNFFPRYMRRLQSFQSKIDEIRIEGHTDSFWNQGTDSDTAYFLNMGLSQHRTREVLRYIYGLPQASQYREQVREQLSAVGMSSSKLKYKRGETGVEDKARSRRVSFRIITNAETQIEEIMRLQRSH